jgi:hypothetical protein
MPPLPIRIAHPPRPQLEHLSDDYFRFIRSCGYQGLYLQDSPFDGDTGNHGPFKRLFHLIYLYDLARGRERQRYVDYINEVCRRAARHGLEIHLNCWEPRLPHAAWAETPPEWRGRGGFPYAGGWKDTSFCWSVPEAVAYWQALARDAFAALPGIKGVHLGVVDNEANFCDESCPRCRGQSKGRQLEDIYRTFAEVKRGRPGFRIAIYDWWLPSELLDRLRGIVGDDALIIGRSSQGHRQDGLEGSVEDMTMVMDGCGPGIVEKQARADRLGLRLVDMPAWSTPNEAIFLPAAPDPRYAVNKLNALAALGAQGWYDFDCGATEPGSIAAAIRAWTADPTADPDRLVDRVLAGIWGAAAAAAAPAYALFRTAKARIPIAYHDPGMFGGGFSGRFPGLGLALFGPFRPQDLRFIDTGHSFFWAAPYNLITRTSIPVLLPRMEDAARLTGQAWEILRALPAAGTDAVREVDACEIHHHHWRSIRNYVRFAEARLALVDRVHDLPANRAAMAAIARDELDNLTGTAAWMRRNPQGIGNACHHFAGWLAEAWPDEDFTGDLLATKRRSLERLAAGEVGACWWLVPAHPA